MTINQCTKITSVNPKGFDILQTMSSDHNTIKLEITKENQKQHTKDTYFWKLKKSTIVKSLD